MVAPHPELLKRIRNTRKLVKERKEHLIPGLVRQLPQDFVGLDDFNIIERIRPWYEQPKPVLRSILDAGTRGISTLQPPVQDKIIVLCVDFPDRPAQVPLVDIYNGLFPNTGKTVRSYYSENSYGKYIPSGEVHGWYRAPQNYGYYVNGEFGLGNYPFNMQKLVEDTISIAVTDPSINWGSFDLDSDSTIDHLAIVHAGPEAAATGSVNDFWAHKWEISPQIRAGYWFQHYFTTSEYISSPSDAQRAGVFAHEFAHSLGLPDLYDNSGNSNGVGMYSLMSHGSWADNGITPVHLDTWCKTALGYTNTMVDWSDLLPVNSAETSAVNYKFTTSYSNEYFLLENRQKIGFDVFLPCAGILIWKVNEIILNNDNEICYKVGLVQADGRKDLENSTNLGDDGDAFPGSTLKRSFARITTPSNVLCDGSYPVFSISSITDSAPTMSFVAALCPAVSCQIQVI
jgi:immune inhibitor A